MQMLFRPLAQFCSRSVRLVILSGAIFGLIAQPATAQSILRDAETEALLQEMMDPLTVAAGMPAGAVKVTLINDPSINAFVAGGQRVFVHSGLISAADTANEVQGVLAHELGHITGGHIIRLYDSLGRAQTISIVSMLVGVAAALAGAGDAAMGAMALGQQAATTNFLSFSRAQESSADAAGADYLSKAGITGRGSLEFFKKLQNLEYRYGIRQDEEAGFARTHPLSGDRIARLQGVYEIDPAWNTAPNPDQEKRFQRIKAKLYGYLAPPARVLQAYPVTDNSPPARYARAYAFHKQALMPQALAETEALIALEPDNPYYLELEGQVLLESGRPAEAIEPLRKATKLSRNQPLIASIFGHALLATDDSRHLDEAEEVLRAAVQLDKENPFAWYQLGAVYSNKGDIPRARLASAEQQAMTGNWNAAVHSAESALRDLPQGTPDWLRAQDVAMQARAELERKDKRK